MIVKPAKGLTVLDPSTMTPLPPEGIQQPDGDLHWERMALDGDVKLEPDPAPATSSSKATDK